MEERGRLVEIHGLGEISGHRARKRCLGWVGKKCQEVRWRM